MFGMGIGELLVILVIVLVVFGAGRLPEVMGSLGKGVQAFKKGLREPPEIDVTPEKPEPDVKAKPQRRSASRASLSRASGLPGAAPRPALHRHQFRCALAQAHRRAA